MINELFVEGNLGRDATEKQSKKGEPFTTFSMAVFRGEDKPAMWLDVLAFKYTSDKAKTLKKGDRVLVKGKLDVTKTDGEDGKTYTNVTILANDLSRIEKGPGKTHDATTTTKTNAVEDLSIPF